MGAGASSSTQGVSFVEDEASACHTCANPCEAHAIYPGYLKISTEGMEGSCGRAFGKHLVICTNTSQWPARVLADSETFPYILNTAIQHVASRLPWRVVMTASDEASLPIKLAEGAVVDKTEDFFDVLVFPDMLRIRSVSESRCAGVAQFLLGQKPAELIVENLEVEAYIAVCTHGARDKRCGIAGPLLIEAFQNELEKFGLNQKVQVSGASHIGGHKFAGTCIIYPNGDWFGRLTPCDAQNVVEQYVKNGKVVRSKWRGRPPVVSGF